MSTSLKLSDEQQLFIEEAKQGKNILVDACIGSGKTTAIQNLCNMLPDTKKILYLTYNRLLKLDAQSKIKKKNVTVTNYHGFACKILYKNGDKAAVQESIQKVIKKNYQIKKYDVLIIDEYQDIDQELADLLQWIKNFNLNMQIIAVGDMEQKIYDRTKLDIGLFIKEFLEDPLLLRFTQCFRLSNGLAAMLGRIWKKTIEGKNDCCKVEKMTQKDVVPFLMKQNPADILCLGSRSGIMKDILNDLEKKYPDKFNKKTVYATISDSEDRKEPKKGSAIFTTYDSSKGMERKICIICDFTMKYWCTRLESGLRTPYDIIRNIFCVAASRGKNHIIFVSSNDMLSEKTLSTYVGTNQKFKDLNMSKMFEFKFKEDIENCFSQLKIQELTQEDTSLINIKERDYNIDLSPCIGIYQQAVFFDKYQIDEEIEFELLFKKKLIKLYTNEVKNSSLDKKILFLVSLQIGHNRYREQVEIPFVNREQSELIKARLKTKLNEDDNVQIKCEIAFSDQERQEIKFRAKGIADVVKDDIVYELKFVSELSHEHFLQCASYMIAMSISKGILWNIRNNKLYQVEIPDKKAFLDAVTKTITRGIIENYYQPFQELSKQKKFVQIKKERIIENKFAVIDTEKNQNNKIMSIGIVVADCKTKTEIDSVYYIIDPEYQKGGRHSDKLWIDEKTAVIADIKQTLKEIKEWLKNYNVKKLFAYNAISDMKYFPRDFKYKWYDIMRLATYRQYNKAISSSADCFKTGKLKRGYGIENIMKMLSKNEEYCEAHNAFLDARNELKIMQLLECEISKYNIARIHRTVFY